MKNRAKSKPAGSNGYYRVSRLTPAPSEILVHWGIENSEKITDEQRERPLAD